MFTFAIADFDDPEDAPKLARIYFHWTGPGRGPRRWLRKRRRHPRVERRVPLDLFHRLMDMAVEHRDRAEPLQVAQGALPVTGPPAPLWIDHPERHMSEHHHRRAVGNTFEIISQPFQLRLAELAKTALADVHNVV